MITRAQITLLVIGEPCPVVVRKQLHFFLMRSTSNALPFAVNCSRNKRPRNGTITAIISQFSASHNEQSARHGDDHGRVQHLG